MPTPRKATLTEIHGPDGELIVLPESPLEITRRVNMFEELVEALTWAIDYVEGNLAPGTPILQKLLDAKEHSVGK